MQQIHGGFDTNAYVDELDDMMEGTTRVMEEYATRKKCKTYLEVKVEL